MILADTSAIVALVDADDRHHRALVRAYEEAPDEWRLPWAILPEVDYLLAEHVGGRAAEAFVADLAAGTWQIEWGKEADLVRARDIAGGHRALRLGLVDTVIMAMAERLRPRAVATLDLRHFGAVKLRVDLRLVPRDLEKA